MAAPERVGREAALQLFSFLESEGSVEEHLADQLLIPAALLASGRLGDVEPGTTSFRAAKVTGDKIEVWAPTQAASLVQIVGGIVFKIKPENITVHTTLLGGGFGRRFELDFIFDAIILSQVAGGKPVKVIWSREDDIQNDKFRPLTAQRFQVGLDGQGNVVGLHHRIVSESIFGRVDPDQPDRVVEYGETGRVRLTTLTKEFFMPRFLERDEAEREPPCDLYPWDGVRNVRPFSRFQTSVVEGVY